MSCILHHCKNLEAIQLGNYGTSSFGYYTVPSGQAENQIGSGRSYYMTLHMLTYVQLYKVSGTSSGYETKFVIRTDL
jgi:hypothetical protein